MRTYLAPIQTDERRPAKEHNKRLLLFVKCDVSRWQGLAERGQIALQPLPDRLGLAAQNLVEPLASAVGPMRVQPSVRVEHRHRHYEAAL
jgi:hypothetical protein